MNRSDFQRLAELRLRDAEVLFAAGAYEGSYYLAGYAVECALKACIAKGTQEFEFPDRRRVERSYTHNLAQLLNVVELRDQLGTEDEVLQEHWKTVESWTETSRYALHTSHDSAQTMINAVRDGVLPWLKRHW